MDLRSLLAGLGPGALAVIAVLVLIESGVLLPFLPGDSLLISAGLVHCRLGLEVRVLVKRIRARRAPAAGTAPQGSGRS